MLDWTLARATLVRTDNFWRAEVFARLATYFDGQKRVRAIEQSYFDLTSPLLAQAAETHRKIEVLIQLVKISDQASPIIQAIHRLIADYLLAQRGQERAFLLFANLQFLSKLHDPILPPSIHAELVKQIIDICERWHWL
jgi:hypothetical protein